METLAGWMTVEDAAKHLGVSARRINQFVAGGRLSARLVGRLRLIKASSVKSFAGKERPAGRPRKERAKT